VMISDFWVFVRVIRGARLPDALRLPWSGT
jgi:hypothetical protein